MCLHYIYELLNDLNNIMSANTLDLLTDYIYSFSLSVQPKHEAKEYTGLLHTLSAI